MTYPRLLMLILGLLWSAADLQAQKKAKLEELDVELEDLQRKQSATASAQIQQAEALELLRLENALLKTELRELRQEMQQMRQQFALQYPPQNTNPEGDGLIPPIVDARQGQQLRHAPTQLLWDTLTQNLGELKAGAVAETVFRFRNTGEQPLYIDNAYASCGCLVLEYPRNPIPPGGSAEVRLRFYSKGLRGEQDKRLFIQANTLPSQTVLQIRAKVN